MQCYKQEELAVHSRRSENIEFYDAEHAQTFCRLPIAFVQEYDRFVVIVWDTNEGFV
jgi:hypothetical protein